MSLEFRHIAHAYGPVRALENVSLAAAPGEITCLLGSSGCGKSTLLGLAAGLLTVQRGSISLSGEVLADENDSPPPERRPVGLVFQDGALFPHMDVATNIGFGLPSGERGAVARWLDMVGLSGMGSRYPHELSGGQQQRAALARAMAPGPRVLLMDEPFASVDIVLRRRLRRDCRILLREQGATTLLVTHDPAEALDVADRIAVMEAGRIVQCGTPDELHDTPAAASVGAIFGGAQVIEGQREAEGVRTAVGNWPYTAIAGALPDSDRFDLLVYAENCTLAADPAGLRVRDVHPTGEAFRVLLVGHDGVEVTVHSHEPVSADTKYAVLPRAESVRAFARD